MEAGGVMSVVIPGFQKVSRTVMDNIYSLRLYDTELTTGGMQPRHGGIWNPMESIFIKAEQPARPMQAGSRTVNIMLPRLYSHWADRPDGRD